VAEAAFGVTYDGPALVNLYEIVVAGGAGMGGLLWLIKTIRRRKVVREERAPDPGRVRLTLDDGTTIDVPTETAVLYRRSEVRRTVRQVVAPLENEGVESVEFYRASETSLRIERADLSAFDVVTEAEPLGEDTLTMHVAIASVAFKERNKWRITDGAGGTYWATMEDAAFLARVDRGEEAFRKGDMLRCRIRISQSRDEEGLHTEYTILEVLDHLPRAVQMELDDSDDAPA
jgi:hypothetical protein